MINQVFISYRHEHSEHARAVRRFAELLRQAALPVIFDQFYLDENPGGPDEGWPKWCEDHAKQSACIIIIASGGWFAACDKSAKPGMGLGAATEAELFRQALYDDKDVNIRLRLVFLNAEAPDHVSGRLHAWPSFQPLADDAQLRQLIRWAADCLGLENIEPPTVQWPEPATYEPLLAGRRQEWAVIRSLLSGRQNERIVLIEGAGGLGKTALLRETVAYAKQLAIPVGWVQFKDGVLSVDKIMELLDLEIGSLLPNFSRKNAYKTHVLREDLRALRQPVLLVFDSYEAVAENPLIADWLNQQILNEVETALGICVIIAGQKVPSFAGAGWRDLTCHVPLQPLAEPGQWQPWIERRYPQFSENHLPAILKVSEGNPAVVSTVCEVIARTRSSRSIDELLENLAATQGDIHAQAALAAEFMLSIQPEALGGRLRSVLDAASVLHRFDVRRLAQVLKILVPDANQRIAAFKSMPFAEVYRSGDGELLSVHEATRLGWRKKLVAERLDDFRRLSLNAAASYADDQTVAGRLEWIYQLLGGDPDQGAAALESLEQAWTGSSQDEDRYALASALKELEETQPVFGRARGRILLAIAWAQVMRGETSQLNAMANEVLYLAQEYHDSSAEAEVQCLLGDISQAQGYLESAGEAYTQFLEIFQKLAEQDSGNACWQHELAVAHSRIGEVRQVQGNREDAHAAYANSVAIFQRLTEQYSGNTDWQRDLAVVYSLLGDVRQAQGDWESARAAYAQTLSIFQRLAEQEPGNAGWQRDLAVAHSLMGDVRQVQGDWEGARAAYAQTLAISQGLVKQDPCNAERQRDLAVTYSRIGDVRQAQGDWEGARAVYIQNLVISQRLAEQDPGNTDWQRGLAVAHSRIGDVLQWQGDAEGALAVYAQTLKVFQRLFEQGIDGAAWQRDLAVAHSRIGDVLQAQGDEEGARMAYAQTLENFQRLAEQGPVNDGDAVWQDVSQSKRSGKFLKRMAMLDNLSVIWQQGLRVVRNWLE